MFNRKDLVHSNVYYNMLIAVHDTGDALDDRDTEKVLDTVVIK